MIKAVFSLLSPSKNRWRLKRAKQYFLQSEDFVQTLEARLVRQMDERASSLLRGMTGHLEQTEARLGALLADLRAARAADKAELNRLLLDTRSELLGEVERLKGMVSGANGLAYIASRRDQAPLLKDGPLISVIMPTYNRAQAIQRALLSLLAQQYRNFECLIVDDGGTDDTAEILKPFLQDSRFVYHRREHLGVSLARNFGIDNSSGEIIAFLDTDNEWLPDYLANLAWTYHNNPHIKAAYSALVYSPSNGSPASLLHRPFDYEKLKEGNYIDVNAFTARREVIDEIGGFAHELDRLDDWDYVLRVGERYPITQLPFAGPIYHSELGDRICFQESLRYAMYQIHVRRHLKPIAKGLRVLYVVWHYPQVTETYIEAEISAVKKLGGDVAVYAETLAVGDGRETDTRIFTGDFNNAVREFKPDIVHAYWLTVGAKYGEIMKSAAIPVTCRGHSFEPLDDSLRAMDLIDAVKAVYVYPTLYSESASICKKSSALPVCFDPDLYSPADNKDYSLVVRAGAALPSKDYRTFLETAKLCPEFKFVLILGRAYLKEEFLDEVLKLNEELGRPVEIKCNLQPKEVAEIVRRAGIYMHTMDLSAQFGMPISVAEAMATGCSILLRDTPPARMYVGEVARYYENPSAAARIIRAISELTAEQRRRKEIDAQDYAFDNFVNLGVCKKLVDDWLRFRRDASLELPQSGPPQTHTQYLPPSGDRAAQS